MAVGTVSELALSRQNEQTVVDTGRMVLHYRVEDVQPDNVFRLSKPIFPLEGSEFPPFTQQQGTFGYAFVERNVQYWRTFGLRLTSRRVDYFPGSISDSIVTLIYETSRSVRDYQSGQRIVVWESEISTVSETEYFDLDGQPIVGGHQIDRPVQTDRAIMDGVRGVDRIRLAIYQSQNRVNNDRFTPQGWRPGQSKLRGAVIRPKSGSGQLWRDSTDSIYVELVFDVRYPDWKHRTIELHEDTGLPVMENGRVVVNEHRVYEESDFSSLFSNWVY